MADDAPGALADEATAWIAENWSLDLTVGEWWHRLASAGFAFPTWPEGLGGRGLSAKAARIVARALADAQAVAPPAGVGQTMGAPTVITHGTDAQRSALVPAVANGRDAWCQLFSEPGAGSDLAGLRATAERDGDEWVVNGQKVWNSAADLADKGILLARTDRSVPKHEGISFFVIDMHQPGVEARPLKQMNGEAEFCEVFLTDARVSADQLIGQQGEGWKIAQTTLGYERAGVSSGGARTGAVVMPGSVAGNLERSVAEVIEAAKNSPRKAASGFIVNNRGLHTLAQQHGRTDDPLVRQQLARFKTMTEVNRYNGLRSRAAASRGQRPGPEASTGKLAMSNIAKASRDLTLSLMGPYGMLAGDDAPGDGAYTSVALASFGAGFGGGTDEIQRNVIGERSLGLPREPQVGKGVPFDETASKDRQEGTT